MEAGWVAVSFPFLSCPLASFRSFVVVEDVPMLINYRGSSMVARRLQRFGWLFHVKGKGGPGCSKFH